MKHTGCLHFITLMNLLYLPTSVNCPQDIISHIQVVHRLQVKSMHSLIRVWFLNPFRLPSSQCEAYSQHLYKCQCCFVVDCILQILFSSYPISLSANVCPSPNLENVLSDSVQSLQHGLTVFRDDLTILDHNVPQRRRRLLIVVQDDSPWVGIGLIGIYIIDIVLRRTLLYRLRYRTRFISASSNSWLGISICLFRFIAVCLSLERISARITDATLHAHL